MPGRAEFAKRISSQREQLSLVDSGRGEGGRVQFEREDRDFRLVILDSIDRGASAWARIDAERWGPRAKRRGGAARERDAHIPV